VTHAMTQRHRLNSALAAMFLIVTFAAPLLASEEGAAPDSWAPTIAKIVNFAILAGGVYWFGKKMGVGDYLASRSATIRKDLVDAKKLRAEAEQQLTGVRARLAALPAELAALKQRGSEELAAEKVRLAEATASERARVQEQTRREIELTSRLARRDLMQHGVDLSMKLARTRIERDITAEDRARLIEDFAITGYKPEVRQ
jgi:F-type H+-transporting ATPase subunit b